MWNESKFNPTPTIPSMPSINRITEFKSYYSIYWFKWECIQMWVDKRLLYFCFINIDYDIIFKPFCLIVLMMNHCVLQKQVDWFWPNFLGKLFISSLNCCRRNYLKGNPSKKSVDFSTLKLGGLGQTLTSWKVFKNLGECLGCGKNPHFFLRLPLQLQCF